MEKTPTQWPVSPTDVLQVSPTWTPLYGWDAGWAHLVAVRRSDLDAHGVGGVDLATLELKVGSVKCG
jgi:hypothetical protein